MEQPLTVGDIYRARRTIAPYTRRTPLVPAFELSRRHDADIMLKLETLQDTGAVKLRGATNAIVNLTDEQRQRGVVTVSTGNHGRAVAYAARRLGVSATVCMSELVPRNKVEAIAALGADVRIIGRSQDEAQLEADQLVAEQGRIPIPPFDHPDIVAGQGVIGLELLEDQPDLDCILVPLSGGGLIAGIALAVKTVSPQTRIVGISMERGPAMYHSIQAGQPVAVEEQASLADSLGGGIGLDNRYTFPLVHHFVDDIVLLTETEIAAGMDYLYRHEQLVVEGGAAVGAAALLAGKVKPGRHTALIVSGRNVDMADFTAVITGSHPDYQRSA